QLMGVFFLSIYILDVMRLTIFLFLIPIIWFYSLFDAMQHVAKFDREETQDVPIVEGLTNHQKWLGIALLLLGVYFLVDQIGFGLLREYMPKYYNQARIWFNHYFQTFLVSSLFIFGGLKLLAGSRRRKGGKN